MINGKRIAVVLPAYNAEKTLEATVRELPDLVELSEPLVEDGQASGTMVASPWTGRRLDLNTYLQACFVWYGLWNLWRPALASTEFDTMTALRYTALSAHGFVSTEITKPLVALRAALAPQILDVLSDLQTTVRRGMADIDALRAAVG